MSSTSAIIAANLLPAPQPASIDDIIALTVDALDARRALLSMHAPGRAQPRILALHGFSDAADAADLAACGDDWAISRFDRRRSTDSAARLALCDGALVLLFMPSGQDILLLTLTRHDDERGFDSDDCARAETMHGWIANALTLADYCASLEARTHALEAALDVCDAGLVLLDAQATILHANRQAETLLARRDGIGRTGNGLSTMRLQDTLRLQTAIRHVAFSTDDRHTPLLFIERDEQRPLLAAVVGLGHDMPDDGPAVLLYMLDPDTDLTASIDPLCCVYGLTPTETRLTRHIVAGLTLAESAARMHIRPQTARAYLKHVFAKTNCARQAELVRIMLTGSARLHSGLEPKLLM